MGSYFLMDTEFLSEVKEEFKSKYSVNIFESANHDPVSKGSNIKNIYVILKLYQVR